MPVGRVMVQRWWSCQVGLSAKGRRVLALVVSWAEVPRAGGGTRGWEMLCGTKLDWDARSV
ncbi:hypothetical protein [Anaplasma marginale]|uniref:hypothetical protein n=1 Tax=Anaplasma marginale TaxID=770 RepID=UPI000E568981|nr:hypothetical protein [Anaplasma marginale]AXW84113.1 hypothetical protein CQZ76_02745 [Anaplasma marginale]